MKRKKWKILHFGINFLPGSISDFFLLNIVTIIFSTYDVLCVFEEAFKCEL